MSHIAKFNPYSMDDKTILALATGRKALLSQVLKTLEDNLGSETSQHLLIRGPRGMGKSFFLKYLQINFRQKKQFQHAEFVLLPEEQGNIHTPADLISSILSELQGDPESLHTTLWEEPDDRWHFELEKFKDYLESKCSAQQDYSLVVVLENLDEFLRQIQHDKKTRKLNESRFRHLLEKISGLTLIGATPTIDADIIDGDYNKRLFHVFKKCTLKRWEEEDYFKYFERRKQEKLQKSGTSVSQSQDKLMKDKLKALNHFTGGSPRMAVVLTNLLLEDDVLSTANTLYGLIDDLTPYYQDLTKNIPRNSRILFDTLIRKGEKLSQSELAAEVGATQSKISKAFSWLKDNGYIIGKKRSNSAAFSYEVADRIYVLYYQQREIHHNQHISVIWLLSDFLVAFFQKQELKRHAFRYLKERPGAEANDMARLYVISSGFLPKDELPSFQESHQWLDFMEEITERNKELDKILEKVEGYLELENEKEFKKSLKNDLEMMGEALRKIQNKKVISGYLGKIINLAFNYSHDKEFYRSSNLLLEKILSACIKKGFTMKLYESHAYIGRNWGNLNKPRKALKYYRRALKIEKNKEVNGEGWIWERVGWNLQELGKYEEAIEAHNKAKELWNKEKNIEQQALNLGMIGLNFEELGKNEQAIVAYQKVLKLQDQLKNIEFQAVNLGQIGWNLEKLGKHEEAIEAYQEALKFSKREENVESQAWNLEKIGENLEKLRKAQEAIEIFKKALNLREQNKNIEEQAWNWEHIGWNLEELEKYVEATEAYQKALKFRKHEKNIELQAWNLGRIGWNLEELGKYEEAIEAHQKALKFRKQEKNIGEQAWNLEKIGWNLKELRKFQKAIEAHQKALELRITENHVSDQTWNLGHIGENHILAGNWEEALSLLTPEVSEIESVLKQMGDAVVFSEKFHDHAKAFEVGNRLLQELKTRDSWMNVPICLSKLFANWLDMKLSNDAFTDLCEEALSIFPTREAQIIIQAALSTLKYVESDKDPAYLETLNPDMAIAIEAIVKEAEL